MQHQAIHLPALPLPALAIVLPTLDRATIEATIEKLIERLDAIDGDPDLEPAGDEADVSWTEWAARAASGRRAAYEQVGDPLAVEDEELSRPEWSPYARCRPFPTAGKSDDDEEHDHGGTDLDGGELDESYGIGLPRFGIDQSRGPTNEVEVTRTWQLGLLNSGWGMGRL